MTNPASLFDLTGRLAVVTHQVAHQDIEDVVIDRDRFAETRHLGN